MLSAEDEAKKMKQGEKFVWSDKVESNKDGKGGGLKITKKTNS